MFEFDLLSRLVIAFAIAVTGLGVIFPSYIMERKRFRVNNS
jgi:hypothetical protein